MVKQYPDKLVFITNQALTNTNCRVEDKGVNNAKFEQENISNFDYILYLPLSSPEMGSGTRIKIINRENNFLFFGNIVKVLRGQLNCRYFVTVSDETFSELV